VTDTRIREGVPAGEVLGPLCEAFGDYPVMRHVLGSEGDFAARLRTLVGFFLVARTLRGDPIMAAYDGDRISGVAVCTLPGLPGRRSIRDAGSAGCCSAECTRCRGSIPSRAA
jgi:hypothetical protein